MWAALLATAIVGTTTYGMTMGLLGGGQAIFYKGFICTFAAGLAWAIPLPALYILNSLSGSRLSASSTLLAALVTVSWGGLAMIASIPINWFFTATVPASRFVLLGEFGRVYGSGRGHGRCVSARHAAVGATTRLCATVVAGDCQRNWGRAVLLFRIVSICVARSRLCKPRQSVVERFQIIDQGKDHEHSRICY